MHNPILKRVIEFREPSRKMLIAGNLKIHLQYEFLLLANCGNDHGIMRVDNCFKFAK